MLGKFGLNSSKFTFKKVDEDVVIYLNSVKNIYKEKKEKHHNMLFEPPFNTEFLRKAKDEGGSTST